MNKSDANSQPEQKFSDLQKIIGLAPISGEIARVFLRHSGRRVLRRNVDAKSLVQKPQTEPENSQQNQDERGISSQKPKHSELANEPECLLGEGIYAYSGCSAHDLQTILEMAKNGEYIRLDQLRYMERGDVKE